MLPTADDIYGRESVDEIKLDTVKSIDGCSHSITAAVGSLPFRGGVGVTPETHCYGCGCQSTTDSLEEVA